MERGQVHKPLEEIITIMNITEVNVILAKDSGKVAAYCSIVIDDAFVVHDIKLLHSSNTKNPYFLSFPSRMLDKRCDECGKKNVLKASFCNYCGAKLKYVVNHSDNCLKDRPYADICNPITLEYRKQIEQLIIDRYEELVGITHG